MSLHPSLNISEKDKKPRSVLKRAERLRSMMEKGHWKEGDSVYGLPKIKTVRIKIKKEKAEKTAEGAVAALGSAPAAAPTKESPAKAASGKAQEKEKK